MYYTSIEQSKRLLELGLNPVTSDMCYTIVGCNSKNELCYCISPDELLPQTRGIHSWSLDALLNVMPKSLEDKVNCYEITVYYSKTECEWYLGYITIDMRRTLEVFHNTSLIEAAYSMVVWLLENGYIKTEK